MSESLDLPRQIRKFNPGTFQSDEEVIRQFVVRKPKLGIVMEILRGNVDSPSCQHVLVVAPRGRGKSMLLARVAAEIRSTRDLCERLLPLRFMEESQEIFDLSDFWLESLFYLARECKECDPELARELEETHTDLTSGWRGEDLEQRARATVLEAADRLGRKLVLMVENLQSLCGNVDDDFGWKLRGALQSEPQIILVATATSRFKGLDDAREPFFELFRIIRLEPLDTGECRRLWQMVSGDKVSERETRPLQILTGGNPRLLVVIGEFARHRSLRELMEELVRLIDDHTEYFRGHLEVFAKTERRVYLATIDLWQPSTTGEIAARARMDVRAVSALLGRLVERGAVLVEGSGRKRMYAAAERLYSIYYKLRRERDEAAVVRNLIHFMAIFYSETELQEWSRTVTLEAEQWPAIRKGIRWAISEEPRIARFFRNIKESSVEIFKQFARATATALEEGKYEEVIDYVEKFLCDQKINSPQIPDSSLPMALFTKALAHAELGNIPLELATYDEIIDQFGKSNIPDVLSTVVRALYNKGYKQLQLGEIAAAIETYGEISARFGATDTPEIASVAASAMVNKGIALEQSGRPIEAIEIFDEIIGRYWTSKQQGVRNQIVIALVSKGYLQGQLGLVTTAISTLDQVVDSYGHSAIPEVQAQVATALICKGTLLAGAGQTKEALAACDEVVDRFGSCDTMEVQGQIAGALSCKVVFLGQLGEIEAAIAVAQTAIERFAESTRPEIEVSVATLLVNKGVALKKLDQSDAAIAIWDDVIERFKKNNASGIQHPISLALTNKGIAQEQHGDMLSAVATYDELVKRFEGNKAPEFQEIISTALTNKGLALNRLGENVAAIATWDKLADYLAGSDVLELQEKMAAALNNKGIAQAQHGEFQAAIVSFENVYDRYGDSAVPELQFLAAMALANKARGLLEIGRLDGVLSTCEEIERRFEFITGNQKIRLLAWRVSWLKTKVLFSQGRTQAATDAFRSVYAAFSASNEAMMHQMVPGVIELIRTGASECHLVEVLSSDKEKASALLPLIFALRQRTGEAIRAPSEVMEVIDDIRTDIDVKVGGNDASSSGTPHS